LQDFLNDNYPYKQNLIYEFELDSKYKNTEGLPLVYYAVVSLKEMSGRYVLELSMEQPQKQIFFQADINIVTQKGAISMQFVDDKISLDNPKGSDEINNRILNQSEMIADVEMLLDQMNQNQKTKNSIIKFETVLSSTFTVVKTKDTHAEMGTDILLFKDENSRLITQVINSFGFLYVQLQATPEIINDCKYLFMSLALLINRLYSADATNFIRIFNLQSISFQNDTSQVKKFVEAVYIVTDICISLTEGELKVNNPTIKNTNLRFRCVAEGFLEMQTRNYLSQTTAVKGQITSINNWILNSRQNAGQNKVEVENEVEQDLTDEQVPKFIDDNIKQVNANGGIQLVIGNRLWTDSSITIALDDLNKQTVI
jgi:hypothetical protein